MPFSISQKNPQKSLKTSTCTSIKNYLELLSRQEILILLFVIEKQIYYLKSKFLGQSIDRGSFPNPEGPGQHGSVTQPVPLPLGVAVQVKVTGIVRPPLLL